MGSSYGHWPSLFKSKPCTSCNTLDDHQWQHGMPIMPSSCSCHKPPLSSHSGEERISTPEAKPRWNPKPEQVRILETIFNSGMVNPPRDEIRRICAQLQGFGHVADANVFYWFQNRKSRSKHKQRHLHSRSRSRSTTITTTTTTAATTTSEPKSLFQTPGVRYCEPPLVSQIPDLTTAIAGTPAEPSSMLWSALFEQREGFKGVAPAPAIALTSTTAAAAAAAAAVNEIQGGDSKVFFGAGLESD